MRLPFVLAALVLLLCTGCKKRYYYRLDFTALLHPIPAPVAVTIGGRTPGKDEGGIQFDRGDVGPSEVVELTYATPCGTFVTKAPLQGYREEVLSDFLAQTEIVVRVGPPTNVDVYFDPAWKGHKVDVPETEITGEGPVRVVLGDCRSLKVDGKVISLPQDLGTSSADGTNDGYVLVSGSKESCYRVAAAGYGQRVGDQNVERLEGKTVYFLKRPAPQYFLKPLPETVSVPEGSGSTSLEYVETCAAQ